MRESNQLPKEKQRELDAFLQFLRQRSRNLIGYPCSGDFNFRHLYDFLEFSVNNVGDPFSESDYRLNSHKFETEALCWYADLIHAPKEEWTGYITAGGTEGNLYGLYLGREMHPDGVFYYSSATHYSVPKSLRLLRVPHLKIPAQENGKINLEELEKGVSQNGNKPAILSANVGTTMMEAIDNIPEAIEIFNQHKIPYYIHVDAALSGMTLPFIENAPPFDFRTHIHSISCSGHKFLGSSIPFGVVITLKENTKRIANSIEYVGCLDTTISGSRNAFAALILWDVIHREGKEGIREKVSRSLEYTEYAISELKKIGIDAWKHPHAITAVFQKPPKSVLKKWFLAVEEEISHIICVRSINNQTINEFVSDFDAALKNDEK